MIEESSAKDTVYYEQTASDSESGAYSSADDVSQTDSSSNDSSDSSADSKPIEFPLDINLATAEELCAINGIGESTALKIIVYRDSVGKIGSLDELVEIDGIGEKTVDMLREYLYVDEKDSVPYVPKSDSQPEETSKPDETYTQTTTAAAEPAYAEQEYENSLTELREIHINSASANEISECLLISISCAEEIVSVREAIGEYSNIDELFLVESLTQSEISQFKDYVIFD
jgi:competence ComEA-like helix-hairpin-helix protein